MNYTEAKKLLGLELESLNSYTPKTFLGIKFAKPNIEGYLSSLKNSDRNTKVIENLRKLFYYGRLSGTGYLSILPADQGVEKGAGFVFSKNPIYFDPENILKLGIEAGCSAIVAPYGILSFIKYSEKIPFILKLNHNELLTFPNQYDQIPFSSVDQALDLGAIGVGATIYFGSKESGRQIQEVSKAFAYAHSKGLFTILWCYTRNSYFHLLDDDYHTSADVTGQANYLGVNIGADIVNQKIPLKDELFKKLSTEGNTYGRFNEEMYINLIGLTQIEFLRFQIANCFLGKIPLISSGIDQNGKTDIQDLLRNSILNKKAGGSGLIFGRKAYRKPFREGVELLNLVQDVYLDKEIDVID